MHHSKLIRAENCVRFHLNPLCPGVKEGCLPQDKSDSDKTVHFTARTSLEKLKNQSGALHFRFFAILHDIRKTFFSLHIQNWPFCV